MKRFVNDLRDRRLLPVIGLLLVCLIAVPILLGGGGGEEAAPPPAVAADASGALPGIETRPVVIASPAELRSYSKRLASFESRNPFHQDLPKPPATSSGSGGGAGSTSTGTGVPDAGTTTPAAPTSTPTIPTIPTTPTEPTTPTGTGGTGGGDKLISIRIDVKAGLAGNLKDIEDVKSLDYLPDPQHPVVQYVSGEFDLSSASFVVSPGIEGTDGDGKCAPSPDNCQFLQLKVGEQQHFVYRAEDYTLKLTAVKRHERPLDAGELDGGGNPGTARGSVRKSASAVEGG